MTGFWSNSTFAAPSNSAESFEARVSMIASISILNIKLTLDIYNHMKAFIIAYGLLRSGQGRQKLFHKIGIFILMINEFAYVAFTGAITFIAFYQIVSSKSLTVIFFNAAGLLFVNEMPTALGLFFKQFILDNESGDNKWIMYTIERPQMEFIAKLVSINGMILMTSQTWRWWWFDNDIGMVQMHNEDFSMSNLILVAFTLIFFITLTYLFNYGCIQISSESFELDIVEPEEIEPLTAETST